MEMTVEQAELFPTIAKDVPRRGLVWHYLKATAEHGTLLPAYLAAEAIGVSRQRVHQLLEDNRIASVEFCGRRFIPAAALELFLSEERGEGIHVSRRWVFTGEGKALGKKTS